MTPRSPTHPQKTSTISRRLRNRQDQSLSVQPHELPHQLRGLRYRRASVLSSSRRTAATYSSEEPHNQPWNANIGVFPHSNTSHPVELTQDSHSTLLLQPTLDITPYHSPQRPSSALASVLRDEQPAGYQVQPESQADILPSPLPSLSDSHTATEFDLRLSVEPELPHDPSLELQDMSALGFMMAPAPYGDHYGSSPAMESPSYPPISQPYTDSKPSTSGSYAPPYPAPSMQGQHQQRRSTEPSGVPPYQSASLPRSPYQQSMGPIRTSPAPMTYPSNTEPSPMMSSAPQSYTYPAIHSNPHPASLGSNTSTYPPQPLYSSSSYEYTHPPATLYPATTSPGTYPGYEAGPNLAPPNPGQLPGPGTAQVNQSGGPMPRILGSRPKPQCWEHGCNGRQFSTFSNLLRHQREKSGTAAKSYCPRCGAEFTRTTARNGHMAHEKCKPRRTSDSNR